MLLLTPLLALGLVLHAAFRGYEVFRMLPTLATPMCVHLLDQAMDETHFGGVVRPRPAVLVSLDTDEERLSMFSHDNFTIHTPVWSQGATLDEKVSVLHDLTRWARTLNVTLEAELPDSEDELAWYLSQEGDAFLAF